MLRDDVVPDAREIAIVALPPKNMTNNLPPGL